MKVGVYLIHGINLSTGGGISYFEKLITTIDKYNFDKELEICFVGRLPNKKVYLKREYLKLSPSIIYKIFHFLSKIYVTKVLSRILFTDMDLCNRFDASFLRKSHVDLLLFPGQLFHEVSGFPFMTMNWDAGHKSTFMFPEFLDGFETRENWYRVEIQKALAVIVESQNSKREFANYFGISENRIEVVPLFPGGVVDLTVKNELQNEILEKFNLNGFSYFYYPAQFWAHKNHYNLIIAFKKLVENNPNGNLRLVFTGSDKGNKEYILSTIKKYNLDREILVYGFVSNDEVYTLYKNAIALVMPTFLGPTNMPLLEARSLRTAVICSDLKGHRDLCEDGALYADPTDPDQWYAAMHEVLNENSRGELISKADKVRATSVFDIQHAIKNLEKIFIKFIPIRKTFN